MTLGKGQTYFISYQGKDGLNYMGNIHNNPSSILSDDDIGNCGLPASLYDWVWEEDEAGETARNFTKMRVILGPYNESYWATDGSSYKWYNLPKKLNGTIDKINIPGGGWSAIPKIIALGAKDNFVFISDRFSVWELSHYRELDFILSTYEKSGQLNFIEVRFAYLEFLKSKSLTKLYQGLFINPYRFDCFILVGQNGTILSKGIPQLMQDGFKAIETAIKNDIAVENHRLSAELEEMAAKMQKYLNMESP
jgi:hypothetical protein